MTDSLVARARVRAAHRNGRVSLELVGPPACPGCRCGRLTRPHGALDLVASARQPLSEGDEVLLTVPAREVLRGALWLHGLPWLALVVGATLGAAAGSGDGAALIGAVVGLGASLAVLRLTRPRWHDAVTATVDCVGVDEDSDTV